MSNVTNQGVITLGGSTALGPSTGTVDLGKDGGSGSMNNTGEIDILVGSDLEISGNYAISGSGVTYFKGASADITSDGAAAATFTNKSVIEADYSGQIGDQGIKSANDLTFVNAHEVLATGSGVTLTLNTGSHTINDGGGLLEAENGAILAIDSNVNTGQPSSGSPPGGTIEAASGGTVTLSAKVADGVSGSSVTGQVVIAGGVFEMLAGASVSVPIEFTAAGTLEILDIATVSVSGSNGAITGVSGDKISLTSGTGDTVTGAGFTVTAASGTGVTVGGNGVSGAIDTVHATGAKIGIDANSRAWVYGSSDTITMLASSNMTVLGSTDAITATTGDKIWINQGTADTITGAGFSVTGASGTGFTIKGTGDVVYAGLNDALTDGGASDTFKISANVGSLKISGFGSDHTGIVDLLNGVGSYTTAAAAFAALTSVGAGGSKLSLGSDGSIDLLGVAPTSLHVTNFKIG